MGNILNRKEIVLISPIILYVLLLIVMAIGAIVNNKVDVYLDLLVITGYIVEVTFIFMMIIGIIIYKFLGIQSAKKASIIYAICTTVIVVEQNIVLNIPHF